MISIRTKYRVAETLIVQFSADEIDESDDLDASLKEAKSDQAKEAKAPTIIDMDFGDDAAPSPPPKKKSQPMRVVKKFIQGTHLTPLTQDIFLPASTIAGLAAQDADPFLKAPREQWLEEVDGAADDLLAWLDGVAPIVD